MVRAPFPIHLAVHAFGNAKVVPDGIATRSAFGPYVEALAAAVKRVTLVAYEPPRVARGTEDLTEFVIQAERGNVDFLSLGPKGTWRDYPARSRRVRQVVERESPEWDVLLLRLVNRRAYPVFRANRCPRVVSIIGGSSLELVQTARLPVAERIPRVLWAVRAERQYKKILARSALAFANGEELVDRYRHEAPHIRLLRSSARRESHSYLARDRLDRPDVDFLIAGQLKQDKGVLDALDAFDRVRSNLLPRARLHIAGTGPALDPLRDRVASRGLEHAVTFYGWIPSGDELFALFRRMDVLLCLSHADFLPRVVWEAMAHSVLVVATRVGSLPRAFRDGEEITFVESSRAEDVERAVADLIARPEKRRSILSAAFQRSKEATLERVVDELVSAIAGRWPELAHRGLRAAGPR